MNHMNQTAAIDPVEVFPQVEKIIYQLAHRFSRTYPITYDECLSEGYYAFMGACNDYKPNRKMKFSSWVYYWVWCKLKDLVMKRSKEPLDFVEIREELLGEAAPDKSQVMELIEDLSDDAKEIVSLLIETPHELVGVAMTPGQFLKRVKTHMLHQGRCPQALDKAYKELRNRFQGGEGI